MPEKNGVIVTIQTNIDLVDEIWPVSLLKCSRMLHSMGSGHTMVILVKDPDVIENLLLLIRQRPELRCRIQATAEIQEITVIKAD